MPDEKEDDKKKKWLPLPGANYGRWQVLNPDDPLPDVDDIDDDDDELSETVDPDLVDMLGFNPRDLDYGDDADDEETVTNDDGSISKRRKVTL
jgi:hypothetical protein